MQLSEYRRNIKGYSFLKMFSMTIKSFKINEKEEQDNFTQYHHPVQKPPVIENMADYYYNRRYFQ